VDAAGWSSSAVFAYGSNVSGKGTHVSAVRATFEGRTDDSPATHEWKVDK